MEEEKYMQRCIQLAQNGHNNVPPNPMVGAVIVCENKIIGEGYHIKFGGPHAEVNAINSIKDRSLLKRSTLYVSLEPCSHYGKTPPCADLIIQKEIPKIVIGCQDPFREVAGRGIKKLRDAGRDVIVGFMEKECKELIKQFTTFHLLKRPYITLKWAESSDGYIDIEREKGSPIILSTELTSMLVHKRRAESNAIMVGTRTAQLDNPALTVRNWYGNHPTRVVIDRRLTLPLSLHLFDNSIKTLVFTEEQYAKTIDEKIEYITLDFKTDIIPQILTALHNRRIQSLFVEGGTILLQSFINNSLWDEVFIEENPIKLGSGVKSPQINDKNKDFIEKHFGRVIHHYINKNEK